MERLPALKIATKKHIIPKKDIFIERGVQSCMGSFLDPTQDFDVSMKESDFVEAWSKLDHQGIVVWI